MTHRFAPLQNKRKILFFLIKFIQRMNTEYKFTKKIIGLLVLSCFIMSSSILLAQESNTSISGKIVSDSGEELIGATISVTNTSTGFMTGTITDFDGTYDIRELPLGGPYMLRASYTGYQDVEKTGVNLGLGDHFTLDFTLNEGTELQTVVVTANNLKARTDRMGSAVAITGKTISTIPTPTRNFEQLSSLSPVGFVSDVGSRNFGGAGVNGVKGGQTGYSVDGGNTRRMVFGGSLDGPAFTISQEAIREFEISTNDYAAKNGRNLGGNISAVTKSGTNELHGSAWYYRGGGDGALTQDKSFTGGQLSVTPTQDQYGASISGPIIKDKLFFFGVFDRFKTSPVANPFEVGFLDFTNSAFASQADAETFYGMSQSEAQSILDAGEAKGYDVGSLGPLLRDVQTQNIFVRLDYNINEKHSASLRYSWLDYFQTNDNSSNNAHGFANLIPNSGNLYGTNASNYLFSTVDHKVLGSLRSQVTDKILNNFKVQYVSTARTNAPNDAEQETRVFVGASNGAVAFGQNTWVPEVVESRSIQIIDDVTIDAGNVTYTLGMNHQFYNQSERLPHYTAPSVIYDNVDDLANDRPSFYNQLVSAEVDLTKPVTYNIAELGFYAQAEMELSEGLKAEVGLRWDGWNFGGGTPPKNDALANSDVTYKGKPVDNSATIRDMNNWQPRLQLTWDTRGDGNEVIKFGAGLFVAPVTTQPITQSFNNNGFTHKNISYMGNDAIMDNLGTGNFADQSSWLSARDLGALPPVASSITTVDADFEMPSAFKTSVSYNRFLTNKIKIGVTGSYTQTYNDNYWQEVNVAPTGINPVDGREVVGPADPSLANVSVFTNANWTGQIMSLVFDITGKLGRDGLLFLAYTKAKNLGNTNYNGGGQGSSLEFVGTDYINRFRSHEGAFGTGVGDKVTMTLATPTFKGFNIGFSFIAAQQRRFTITTGGNPNNGNDTDVAFIPEDLADNDPILASVAPEVRSVINDSKGSIVGINSGRQPWLYQTSASISRRFEFAGKYGFTVRADIFNVLNLINPTAGYYNQVTTSSSENGEQKVQLFNWDGTGYTTASGAGTYSRQGQPYNIQLGLKFDF